jgi:kumamolisin
MPETHTVLAGTHRPMSAAATRVRDIDPDTHVEVTVNLKGPDLPPAGKMPAQALSIEELARSYGAPSENIRRVEHTLRAFGLRVDGVGPTARSLRVSGTAAAMEAAFQTAVAIHHSAAQGEYRGREGSVSVPAEIAGLVDSVVGLDQRRVAHRKATAAAVSASPLGPADLETRYNFPAGDGAGQKIAIAEFGSPLKAGPVLPPAWFPDDVASFCQSHGRPVPDIRTVPVNLAPLSAAQLQTLPAQIADAVLEETGEVMLDVEIVAALCPAAEISVYYASWDQKGWLDLIERVTADQPAALSISYGLAEDSPDWEPAVLQAINAALQAAAMAGITVCVSTGDDGSGCNMPDSLAHVEFPASSPFVLAVGGTMLTGEEETGWWQSPGQRAGNEQGGATGGGVSAIFARPAWQTADLPSINAGAIEGRIVPDAAALAGPPLYQFTFKGQSTPRGGTSASTPVWATLVARLNAELPTAKRQRFLTPLLYQSGSSGMPVGAAGCKDIVSGNNASHPSPGKGYEARSGYDAVTGWGVPDGKMLLAELVAG